MPHKRKRARENTPRTPQKQLNHSPPHPFLFLQFLKLAPLYPLFRLFPCFSIFFVLLMVGFDSAQTQHKHQAGLVALSSVTTRLCIASFPPLCIARKPIEQSLPSHPTSTAN